MDGDRTADNRHRSGDNAKDTSGIGQLGWSSVEALETHLRFRNFADDWDAPGMEAYDDL